MALRGPKPTVESRSAATPHSPESKPRTVAARSRESRSFHSSGPSEQVCPSIVSRLTSLRLCSTPATARSVSLEASPRASEPPVNESWSVIWISAITLKRMCLLEPPSPPPPRAAAAAAATGAQSRDGDTPLVDEPLDDALGTLRRQLDAPRGLDAHLDRRAGKHQVGDADQGRHVDVLDDSGAGLMARGGARAARGG